MFEEMLKVLAEEEEAARKRQARLETLNRQFAKKEEEFQAQMRRIDAAGKRAWEAIRRI